MAREVKARFLHGKIEPLEELDLKEGDQITILVQEDSTADDAAATAAFERSAGSWEGTLDFDEFLTDIRNSRKRPQRRPVDLG
jgi:predicted DNA-binding antitoxin AbrB/MazE fold protein